MRASRSLTGVLLLAGVLAVSGCGSSSGSSGSGTSSSSSQDAARVKLAQCLRGQGLNVSDNGRPAGGGGLGNVDRTKLQSALRACRKFQRGAFGTISSAQRQQFQDAFVKFSSCMRAHGVNVPTPGAGTGRPAGGALDTSDPKVKAAQSACQSKLPRNGPGGGGPGGASGGN